MRRLGRDITIAGAALAAGYLLFGSKAETPVTQQPTYTAASVSSVHRKDAQQQATVSTAALSTEAIAALIVKGSRESYYRSGKRCACPDDRNAGGGKCGRTSAYSRGGGAHVFCSVSDVPPDMITKYRATKL